MTTEQRSDKERGPESEATVERSAAQPPTELPATDRAARRAVTVFPVLVIVAGLIGLFWPGEFKGWSTSTPYLLGVVMFTMGLTLTPPDFATIRRRPWAVLVGLVAHFVIMPGLGWAVAHLLGLSPQLAAGVILVGCAPSGTASNVVTFLARGDVALSVSVATVSTLVAPFATPALVRLLAGEYVHVAAGAMMTDILKTVLVPVLAGLLVRWLCGRWLGRVLKLLPWLSALVVGVIVLIVISGSAGVIKSAAGVVLLAVVLHNGLGLLLGYGAGKATRLGRPASRSLAFEVGMQNSGLAASLATAHFSPVAALPAAIFSVWHNVSGAMAAAWMSRARGSGRDGLPGEPRKDGLPQGLPRDEDGVPQGADSQS
jgi:BASS family bile acid:Na+ symporter